MRDTQLNCQAVSFEICFNTAYLRTKAAINKYANTSASTERALRERQLEQETRFTRGGETGGGRSVIRMRRRAGRIRAGERGSVIRRGIRTGLRLQTHDWREEAERTNERGRGGRRLTM